MSADTVWSEASTRCANLECPNEMHEGQFTLLRTRKQLVGGHRGLTLLLCGPCASVLRRIDGNGAPDGTRYPR